MVFMKIRGNPKVHVLKDQRKMYTTCGWDLTDRKGSDFDITHISDIREVFILFWADAICTKCKSHVCHEWMA